MGKFNKKAFLVLAFFCFCLLIFGCAKKGEYKLSVNVSEETPWGKGAAMFAELVFERSMGKIRIKPYYNMVLAAGDQMREISLIKSGGIDFSLNSTINYTPTIPELNVFSLPFLFPDYSAVDRALSSAPGKMIEEILEKHNMIVLGWGENGFRELTNRFKSVANPEDLEGMKVRVCSPIYIDIFKALNANPVAMVWAEALTAFRKGVVDAEENPVVGVIMPYEIADYHKYLTLWHYSYDALILSCNKDVWNTFTTQQQNLLKVCAHKAMEYQKELARSGLEEALKILEEEKGVIISRLSLMQKYAFRRETSSVYTEYANKIGWDLVKAFETAIQSK